MHVLELDLHDTLDVLGQVPSPPHTHVHMHVIHHQRNRCLGTSVDLTEWNVAGKYAAPTHGKCWWLWPAMLLYLKSVRSHRIVC